MAGTTTLVDRVKVLVLSSGTGPFELGAAVPAFRGVEALVDGALYSYATENGSNFEVGTGVYLASSGTLVRTPLISSAGGAAVPFPANVELSFTILAQDVSPPGSLPIVQTTGTETDKAMSQKATTDALDAKLDPSEVPAALSGLTVQASATITPNQFVNIYNVAGALRMRPAQANDPLTFANGFAPLSVASGATGPAILLGFNAVSVAAPASEVWLSDATPGAFVTSPPTASGSIIQPLGVAIPGVGIFFTPRERVLL